MYADGTCVFPCTVKETVLIGRSRLSRFASRVGSLDV